MKKMIVGLLAFGLSIAIGMTGVIAFAASSNENSDNEEFYLAGTLDEGATYIYFDSGNETCITQEEYYEINPDAALNCEFWEIKEYEEWMEIERTKNQKLADDKDLSFYEKNENGEYICRIWAQKDVDNLYAQWQEQLVLMKQGYRFTKPMELSNGGVLEGAFEPET